MGIQLKKVTKKEFDRCNFFGRSQTDKTQGSVGRPGDRMRGGDPVICKK